MRGFISLKLKILVKNVCYISNVLSSDLSVPRAWATQLVYVIAKLYLKSETRIRGYEFQLKCST